MIHYKYYTSCMKLTYCLLIFSATFTNIQHIHSQLPPRDNFVFTFENNFENDQIGRYDHDDYVSDWNLHSSSELHDKEIIDIIVDSDPIRNKVMRGYYAVGTAGPDQHGFLWYSPIAKPCNELYFSYDIKFKPGFQWVLGGKIPGITGGTVSSDHLPTKESGFSVRHMWKEDGALVFYVYHQDQTINYGSTWYYKDINLESGVWYNLTLRVVLNTFSNGTPKSNGILEGFIDGKLIFQKTDLNYRALESISIDNMYISSFFGGSVEDWAATRDEWIDTDNYVAFTYSSKISTVPRGNE
ncbi:MAG: hypothetical protein JXB49_32730, partial [Bacteroidales bacterium]|nr:hypothetical protein [Bacteroidales bacterium]